jgi:hypothetical protein
LPLQSIPRCCLRFRHWGRLAGQEAVPKRRAVLKDEVDDPKRFRVWQGCGLGMVGAVDVGQVDRIGTLQGMGPLRRKDRRLVGRG